MAEETKPKSTIDVLDPGPGFIDAVKRQLVEDSVLITISELVDDEVCAKRMKKLGCYERAITLARWILMSRAHADGVDEVARDELRKTPAQGSAVSVFDDVSRL